MENSKVYEIVAFTCCSAINDNLYCIYYMYKRYNNKLDNINKNKYIIKIKQGIKEVSKELFK